MYGLEFGELGFKLRVDALGCRVYSSGVQGLVSALFDKLN